MVKIGMIVEGKGDVLFFKDYFKRKFTQYRLQVIPSKTSGSNCAITQAKNIEKKVADLIDRSCQKIVIMLDLDTQCYEGKQFTRETDLITWYEAKIRKIKNYDAVEIQIVVQELESWMYSAFGRSDNVGKEKLVKYFQEVSGNKKSIKEEQLVQRFIASKQDVNPANNQSLKKFLQRLDRLNNAS